MSPLAADLREILEAAFLRLAESECSCVGEAKCLRCAAIEALELIGQAEFVAGLMELGRDEEGGTEKRCDT